MQKSLNPSCFVGQILSLKQKDPQVDTSALEKQIDVMVYKLYGLTCEEVKIIGAVSRANLHVSITGCRRTLSSCKWGYVKPKIK